MRALLLAIFVSSIPGTIILPMMPSLGERYGIGGFELGLLFGVYPFMSFVASPVLGRLSDRPGRRPILLLSLAGAAAAFVAFGLAASFWSLLMARALQGVAGSTRGLGFAIIGDLTKADDRSAGMGYVSAAMATAFTVGPLLGGLFMGENPGPLLTDLRELVGASSLGFDHRLPSLIGAVLNVLGFFVILFGFKETYVPPVKEDMQATEKDEQHRKLAKLLLSVGVLLLISQFLFSGFIQGTIQFSMALWADVILNWTAQQIAYSLAVIGIAWMIASLFFIRPATRRFGDERTVVIGTAIDGLGVGLFLLNVAYWPLALTGLFISTFGSAMWSTTLIGILSKKASDAHQGSILGVANSAGLIGRVIGPAVAGLIVERFNPAAPFIVNFVLVLIIGAYAMRLAAEAAVRRPAAK